jgi:hypothetical protein
VPGFIIGLGSEQMMTGPTEVIRYWWERGFEHLFSTPVQSPGASEMRTMTFTPHWSWRSRSRFSVNRFARRVSLFSTDDPIS